MLKIFFRVIAIYRQEKEAARKQKQLDALKAIPLNYGIIRDLINSARHGVVIDITLADGTKLGIKRDEQIPERPLFGEAF